MALCFIGAAAAALLGTTWLMSDDPVGDELVSAPQPASTRPASGTDTADQADRPGGLSDATASLTDDAIADDANTARDTSAAAATFTVELTRLAPRDATAQSIQFGDWFHAALVEDLLEVPNLVLIEAEEPLEIANLNDGMAPPRPGTAVQPLFDPDPANWPTAYDFRLAAGVGLEENRIRTRLTAISSNGASSSKGLGIPLAVEVTPSPEHAAALAQEYAEALRVEVFPANASYLRQQYAEYESAFSDQSAGIEERYAALTAASQILHRANNPNLTARFVDSALALAPQFESAVSNSPEFAERTAELAASERADTRTAMVTELRAEILRLLANTGDPRLIGRMTDALLYDPSEDVRRVATRFLGQFVDDAIARSALESAAQSDSSEEVRAAARALVLDAGGRFDDIVRTLRDTSLSDSERIQPIMYPGEALSQIESGFNFDPLTVDIIADLIAGSAPAARRQVLLSLSTKDSPSLVPVFIDRLRNDPSPEVRAAATVGLRRQQALSEARAALEAAAMSDVAEEVRAAAERQLDEVSP